MRRYLILFAITLAAGVALSVVARRPRLDAAAPPPDAPIPMVALAVAIEDGALTPQITTTPKGYEVRITVENHGRSTVTLALGGYEDRLTIPALAAGARWSGAFIADRPGEDFAWLVDGRPAGRFVVQGSHLIEGHR